MQTTEINGFLIDNFNQYSLDTKATQGICPWSDEHRKPENRKKIQDKLGIKDGSTIDAKWGPSTEKAWKEASDNKPVPDKPIAALEMLKDKIVKSVGEDRYNKKMEDLKKDFS